MDNDVAAASTVMMSSPTMQSLSGEGSDQVR